MSDAPRPPLAESRAMTDQAQARTEARPAPPPVPAIREDLRDQLPGVEAERRVTDWGRSERIEGLFDRTVIDFFYRYWFRVDVEGIEHVPSHGGALLVSNHAGALPPDAPMIAKAVREEHPNPRPVHLLVEHFFKGYPGFAMLLPKIGAVPAHPANAHRLLYDEGALVQVMPEGRKGSEKLYRDRYRLRRFGRGGFVATAMRARAPIVPIALIGAEEAAPIFAHVTAAAAAHRAALLPDHAHVPALRPGRDAGLPSGQVPHPLPRADPDGGVGAGRCRGPGPRPDGGRRRCAPASRTSCSRWCPAGAASGSGSRGSCAPGAS